LLDSKSHIVVVGRTRSGKTWTAACLVELYLKQGRNVLILDWAGEYSCPLLPRFTPTFSWRLLRRDIAEVVSELVRAQSQTAGTWTFDSLQKCAEQSSTFQQLLDSLRTLEKRPYRDPGARAARIRLEMLKNLFVEGYVPPTTGIIDFSELPITSRKMALSLYLAQLLNMVLRRKLSDMVVVVEEAHNVPKPLLTQLLQQLAGYDVKLICVFQQYDPDYAQYNLIVHDLGPQAREVALRHALPPMVTQLKRGEAAVYHIESKRWRKVKVPRPRIIAILPKRLEEGKSEEEAEDLAIERASCAGAQPAESEQPGESGQRPTEQRPFIERRVVLRDPRIAP